ncbi:hypothetical protein AVEN_234998-1 [Araneus ventricosus]|uniref:Uncharacterized protein n=1 Tax=Araneus ventricosus TaxID=182803 RepID=A0A4Y2FM27_ARAVE|nr:hypothetical protein AVEN_234998-1 [Araneus ventricosus]
MEPSSVNIGNQAEVWHNFYGDISKQKSEKPSFKVDDTLRISKWKGRFEKGYEHNWPREIFTVHQIVPRIPTVYRLRDPTVYRCACYRRHILRQRDAEGCGFRLLSCGKSD